MNLGEMKDELSRMVQDADLQALLTDWINNAILEVATDFELASLKLVDPVEIGVNTSKWLWELPESFHKRLLKAKWVDSDGEMHHVHVHDHIDAISGLNHTTTNDHVQNVAVALQGNDHYLGIYPLAEDTLALWYYRKPVLLVKDGDSPDCIPPTFEPRVIYPRVIVRNFKIITDQVVDFAMIQGTLQDWRGEQAKGDLDLKNYFAKNYNKPRRHGGKDPIGPSRRYFRGYR
jgi:hypothetical protein